MGGMVRLLLLVALVVMVLATAAARLERYHFTGDAAAMWRLADRRQDRADGIDEAGASVTVSKVNGCLNDIVGKGVSKHAVQLNRGEHLIDEVAARE